MPPDHSLVSVAVSAAFWPAAIGALIFLTSDRFRIWRDRRRFR